MGIGVNPIAININFGSESISEPQSLRASEGWILRGRDLASFGICNSTFIIRHARHSIQLRFLISAYGIRVFHTEYYPL